MSVFNWAKNNNQYDFKGTEYVVPVGSRDGALDFLAKTFSVLKKVGNGATVANCDALLNHISTRVVEADQTIQEIVLEDVDPEPVLGLCTVASTVDPNKPVLAGQKARQEIRSVVIGRNSDMVVTSLGEVDLPKELGVIRTPMSNIVIPIVDNKVDDPVRQLMRISFPPDEVDVELIACVYGDDYFDIMNNRENPPPLRKMAHFFKRTNVLDTCCEMLEREYPKYRDDSRVTDSFYHPLDPGRWNRGDIELHVRDMALKRVIRQFRGKDKKKPRIGIITSNDEHFSRVSRLFGKGNVFYPASEAVVDIVLFHPYEKAITYDPGVDPVKVVSDKIIKHAPAWDNVVHWVAPYNDVKFDAILNSARNFGLFSIALHRPRYYITSLPISDMSKFDTVLVGNGRALKNNVKQRIYAKNAEHIAFMLVVSASRNYRLTPRKEIVAKQEWERRGGRISIDRVFRGRNFLQQPVYITGRKKMGTQRGVSSNDTAIIQDVQRIFASFGDKYFTKEALLGLELDWMVIQRLTMKGILVPSKRQGQVYYRIASATTDVEWDVESYPPAYIFGDGVVMYPADRKIATVLPVPISLKELMKVVIKRHDNAPLKRRVYSGGGEEGHVVGDSDDADEEGVILDIADVNID
jgi:hypothetical protein